jgi:hypothetical protein
MFKLNYRITDTNESIQQLAETESYYHVEGFFKIVVNNNEYGIYHSHPLRDGEVGMECLLFWFTSFLSAAIELKKNDYVLINEIDSYNTWIELSKDSDFLKVNILRPNPLWHENNIVPFTDFFNETIKQSQNLYNELTAISSNTVNNKMIVEFINLLHKNL